MDTNPRIESRLDLAIIFCLGVLVIVMMPDITPNPVAANTPNVANFTSSEWASAGPHWVYRGRDASVDIPNVVANGVYVDALVLLALLDLQAQTDSTRLDSILSLYHVKFTYPGGCLGAGCNE